MECVQPTSDVVRFCWFSEAHKYLDIDEFAVDLSVYDGVLDLKLNYEYLLKSADFQCNDRYVHPNLVNNAYHVL